MNSLESLVKDKRSLVFELLFSLDGIGGDLVAIEANNDSEDLQLNSSSIFDSIGLSEINFINELMKIGSLYYKISCFVQKYSSDSNRYHRQLAQTIDEVLVDYRNDLIGVEIDINRDSHYSLIKFNKFFKYLNTFRFLDQLITKSIEYQDFYAQTLDLCNTNLSSGFNKIQKLSQMLDFYSDIVNKNNSQFFFIPNFRVQHNNCLYSDLFSWIFYGYLSKNSENNFFIKENDYGGIDLDLTRLPAFIGLNDAIRVKILGETVRSAQKRKVEHLFGDKQNYLFEQFIEFRAKYSADKTYLTQMLDSVQSVISEENWNYIVNEQQLKDVLTEMKGFYFTANDNFWSAFVTHVSNIVLNGEKRFQRDLEKAFELSIRQVMNEVDATKTLSRMSIICSKNSNNYSFNLKYEVPLSLSHIITEESLEKYNKIMNFMAKLYSSRFQLNKIWLKTIGFKGTKKNSSKVLLKALILRHSLSFVINCFNHFFKSDVIEILFNAFINKIDGIKDVDGLQKEHQIFLTETIGQMFLKTPVINKSIERLFNFCSQFGSTLESEECDDRKSKQLDDIIEDFERTKSQCYHLLVHSESYKSNKMISRLVLEIEKCIK